MEKYLKVKKINKLNINLEDFFYNKSYIKSLKTPFMAKFTPVIARQFSNSAHNFLLFYLTFVFGVLLYVSHLLPYLQCQDERHSNESSFTFLYKTLRPFKDFV